MTKSNLINLLKIEKKTQEVELSKELNLTKTIYKKLEKIQYLEHYIEYIEYFIFFLEWNTNDIKPYEKIVLKDIVFEFKEYLIIDNKEDFEGKEDEIIAFCNLFLSI